MSGRRPPGGGEWLLKAVRVDPRHRLTLPAGIEAVVPWLRAGVETNAYLTGQGMLLVPAPQDELRGKLRSMLTERPLEIAESSGRFADVVRYAAMSWSLTLDDQLRLTVPEDPRKLGVLPGAGEQVVVFASGELLELWRVDSWLRRVGDVAAARLRLPIDIEDR